MKALPPIALGLILLAAAALRFHDITRHSLWVDELYSLQTSAGHGLEHQQFMRAGLVENPPDLLSLKSAAPPWAVATTLARDDNHPPLYFLFVRAWRNVFGDSDVALRAFSAFASVVAVWLLFEVMRILHGVAPGLWAAAIMAAAGPQIQFAQEARAYTLLLALFLGACAALVRIERFGSTRLRLTTLAACAVGMMLTHYYAIAPCAALGLYAVIQLRDRPRRDTVLALIAAACVFAAAWGWGVWRQRDNVAVNNWWVIDETPGNFALKTLWRLALQPFQFLAEPMRRAEPVAAIAGTAIYIVPLFLLRRRRDLLLWVIVLYAVIGMVLTLDVTRRSRQLEFARYTIAASPAVYALIAALMPATWPRLRHALPAAALLHCLVSLPIAYEQTLTPKPDWRELARYLDANADPTDVVLFYDDNEIDRGSIGSRYLALRRYAQKMPRTVAFIGAPPDPALLDRLRRGRSLWLVIPRESTLAPHALPGFEFKEQRTVFGSPHLQRWVPRG